MVGNGQTESPKGPDLNVNFEEFRKILEAKIDELTARFKEELGRVLEAYKVQLEARWKLVSSPKPVDPGDRAILWLGRKLTEIQARHPGLRFEFITDANGWITGLRYTAPDEETEADVEAPARWAFQKASERPQQGSVQDAKR